MNRQKGVALIIVLLVVAIVTVLATEMGGRLQLQMRRAQNITDNNQAYWYAMGAEEFARKSITTLIAESNGVVSLSQPWATNEFSFPVTGGSIEAKLVDMQSCFNMNALVDATRSAGNYTAADAFKVLLNKVQADIPELNIDIMTDSLKDWLDDDDDLTGYYGAEDAEYESRLHPYLAANSLMAHKSELRLVNGAESVWINDVMPLVCAIPAEAALKINVNTIDEETLPVLQAALSDQLSDEDASSILSTRPEKGYEDINDFFNVAEVGALNLTAPHKLWFDITTHYFILHTNTRYNSARFAMSSVLKIDQNNQVKVIRREFGGLF
ncbi:type II secretion system minor pseudopilin GspK [Alteromonadaceae bacterium BrNp21-10]|nr:type II secretion system minor pseudopilin GspK [Alteromonadaceae bacterium BrNp21-10]